MSCSVTSLLSSAAANGFFSLQDRELRIAILQLLCSGTAGGNQTVSSVDTQVRNVGVVYTNSGTTYQMVIVSLNMIYAGAHLAAQLQIDQGSGFQIVAKLETDIENRNPQFSGFVAPGKSWKVTDTGTVGPSFVSIISTGSQVITFN